MRSPLIFKWLKKLLKFLLAKKAFKYRMRLSQKKKSRKQFTPKLRWYKMSKHLKSTTSQRNQSLLKLSLFPMKARKPKLKKWWLIFHLILRV